mgnify:CR=1 FL=1|tara:strand:- start:1472 stop:2194 length:723 start_codon:yes stop_codon:yes gene_type:complete
MKKLSALIPARGGSKGVPKKNIKKILNFPLITYSIFACKMCENIDRVIVSTDDPEIAEIATKYGAEVPFLRPKEFSQDNSTDLDVLRHFFSFYDFPEVAYIRPTTPLRNPFLINSYVAEYFKNKDAITSVRSMHELAESPYKFFQIKDGLCYGFFEEFNGIKDYTNLPRQIFPKAYHPNGYFDIVKRDTIENGSTFGSAIYPIITDYVTEIDTVEQFQYLEYEMEKNPNVVLEKLQESGL